MCGPHQVWPLRSECCGRGVPTKVVCAECMKMCCLGGKNSVVKGLKDYCLSSSALVMQYKTTTTTTTPDILLYPPIIGVAGGLAVKAFDC